MNRSSCTRRTAAQTYTYSEGNILWAAAARCCWPWKWRPNDTEEALLLYQSILYLVDSIALAGHYREKSNELLERGRTTTRRRRKVYKKRDGSCWWWWCRRRRSIILLSCHCTELLPLLFSFFSSPFSIIDLSSDLVDWFSTDSPHTHTQHHTHALLNIILARRIKAKEIDMLLN
jgi:hypothetical protein